MNNNCCSGADGACATGSAQPRAATRGPGRDANGPTFRPTVDVYESRDEFVVTADVPGATPESVDIDLDAGSLTIRTGVVRRDPAKARAVHREYGVGDFARSFRIGDGIDADRITASLEAGVLTVRLPKAEAVRPRKIAVNAGS